MCYDKSTTTITLGTYLESVWNIPTIFQLCSSGLENGWNCPTIFQPFSKPEENPTIRFVITCVSWPLKCSWHISGFKRSASSIIVVCFSLMLNQWAYMLQTVCECQNAWVLRPYASGLLLIYMIAGTWCALCWVWNTDSCYSSNWNYYSHYSEHRHHCTPKRRSTSWRCRTPLSRGACSFRVCRPGHECLIIYEFNHKLSIQICIYRHLEKDALNYESMYLCIDLFGPRTTSP